MRSSFRSAIARRGVQSPTWKKTVPPQEPILTWNILLKSQQNFQTRHKKTFKLSVYYHLKYILQKVFKTTVVKLTIGRLSQIGIHWYQSTNRFKNSHLFIHFRNGGLTIDLMLKPPFSECKIKLKNYIRNYVLKRLNLKYVLKVERVTKSS